jgi:hypothetical protein
MNQAMSELKILRQQRDAYRSLAIRYRQDLDSPGIEPAPSVERATEIIDGIIAKLCPVAYESPSTAGIVFRVLPPVMSLTDLNEKPIDDIEQGRI